MLSKNHDLRNEMWDLRQVKKNIEKQMLQDRKTDLLFQYWCYSVSLKNFVEPVGPSYCPAGQSNTYQVSRASAPAVPT